MEHDTKMERADVALMLTNSADLLGKRSVRATFRLSAEFIEALSILSTRLGIKQKSLFDHLMEDMDTLQAIARRMNVGNQIRKGRIQKTFVISRKSLASLDSVSKKYSASRDDIVESSIRRLLPILAAEQQKQKKRETALNKIGEHLGQTATLIQEIEKLLEEEDPILLMLKSILNSYENAYRDVDDFVTKGKRIKTFPIERFQQ